MEKEFEFIGQYLGFLSLFLFLLAIFLVMSITTILKNQCFIVEKLNDLKRKIDSLNDKSKPKN